MLRRFRQVDVFSETPYAGNPVAVVSDADGLSTEQMQAFASWTNLSETTFLLPPSDNAADYRVRIFTPTLELPFAGHPTLGTCHTWLADGGTPSSDDVVQECGAGLVTIRRDGPRLAFAEPPLIRSGPVDEPLLRRITTGLGLDVADVVDAAWVDNGPGWVAVLLADADAVLALPQPQLGDLDVGVVGPYPSGAATAIEVRAFFPTTGGTGEDPVTGSLNASVARWLLDTGRRTAPYVASQGTKLGRAGRVHVGLDGDGTIWVGGATRSGITGSVDF